MSKVDELIRELCPDGVQRVALGELLSYEQPGKYAVKSAEYHDEYKTPVLTAGQSFVLGYTNEEEGIYPASLENPVVIFDDFTTSFKWVDFPFKVKSSAMKLLKARSGERDDLRFIYYAMQTINYQPVEHARQWIGIYAKFQIPLPPLQVQEEIVRILDQFMELDRELEQEITGREAQRRALRARYFECVSGYDLAPLRDLGQLITGRTPTKADRDSWGDEFDFVTPGDISEDAKLIGETSRSLSESGAKKFDRIAVGPNSVLTVCIGASLGKIGIVEKLSFTNQQINSLVVEEGNDPNYVYYALENSQPQLQQLGGVGNSSMPLLNKSVFSAFEIPLPPLEAQQEIANKLDTFTEYIDSLKRERELRQKQYEYYRDLLLDFPVKE